MDQSPGRRFLAAMTEAPGKVTVRFQGRTACGCGCGMPARVEFAIGDVQASIDDPIAVDALVDVLVESRAVLWGPRPAKAGG